MGLKPPNMATDTKINMKDLLRGILFVSLWYLSILAGFFFLVCPIIPLIIISPKRYRKYSDVIFGMWEPFPVALMEICFGIRVILTGDKINPFEGSLFVANHRTRVDWNFLWMGLFHCCQPNAHNMKYVLKAPIMHVPGPGWVMQTCSFIFIHRNWDKDQALLNKMLDYLNESDSLYQILLFPEGTDLSESNIVKSHKYADEHNLERYYKVLHPRTTGFAFLARKMKSGGQLKAIYDVTVAYPKTTPQNEVDLLRGKFPEEVHLHVKRHSSSVIPTQETDLKKWLTKIWREKEQKLQNFYSTGSFSSYTNRDIDASCSNKYSDHNSEKKKKKNGIIEYKYEDTSDQDLNIDEDLISEKNGISLENLSLPPGHTLESLFPLSGSFARSQTHCDNVYTSENYKPSHLLYLVLSFWMILIIFSAYQVYHNYYAQMWVVTHSILFTILSFTTQGFHQVTASMYFFRYNKKPGLIKKTE